MSPSIHFYDAQYVGSPALGQLTTFDSILYSSSETLKYSSLIALRPDVSFSPQAIEQSDCFDVDVANGVSEYEWSRTAQSLLGREGSLNVGLGNTSLLDNYIRFAMYRSLSTLPNTRLPTGSYYFDLLTFTRALSLLKPESLNLAIDQAWSEQRKRDFVMWQYPACSRAMSIKAFAKELSDAHPKMYQHAIRHSSPMQIANALGLQDGQVESLSTLRPVFICHEQLCTPAKHGVFMALATDPQYANVIYMIDLGCDLRELLADGGASVQRFIRSDSSQADRPIVRVNLNRVPFVSSLGALTPEVSSRLNIQPKIIKSRAESLRDQVDLSLALMETSSANDLNLNADADYQLYGSEYLAGDKALIEALHASSFADWYGPLSTATDARIETLGHRLIGRLQPSLLNKEERSEWAAHCAASLLGSSTDSRIKAASDYCNAALASDVFPAGLKTFAKHWLQTIETSNARTPD